MPNTFTHLHLHTQFSLLDGCCTIKDTVALAKEMGMEHLAITDHGAMFGVVDFYEACKEAGINPVIGCEVYLAPRTRFDRDSSKDREAFHLILFAKNQEGYRNLIKMVSVGYTEGFYYKPRVDFDLLREHREGIIATTACIGGMVPQLIIQDRVDEAREVLEKFIDIFGKDDFYIEIQDHGLMEEKKANEFLIAFAREYKLKLIATNDAHYIRKTDAKKHDILLCVQTSSLVTDEKRMRFTGEEFYFKSPEEMSELFSYVPEAISNTVELASKCHVEFDFGNYHLPVYPLPQGVTSKEYLRSLCISGLEKRYTNPTKELMDRLENELGVINNMGFNDYFLIVWDFIKYAKDNGIAVGPGRGSAAGSLVAYCLKITEIDPIKYSLIFERFLNKDRVSMPDIDIDFCYENRHKVIEYVIEKYSKSHVAQIATFGTLAAKMAIKDVGRAMGVPLDIVNKIAKEVPSGPKITLSGAISQSDELKKMMETDASIKLLLETALALEGSPRHVSTHAAGVVISDRDVSDYVPLCTVKEGMPATQFSMTTIEHLGLLKMDFLGLRNLTVIDDAIKMIEKNKKVYIDFNKMELNDPNVFATISSGDTLGIFQLESAGMRNFMMNLKPDTFEDIIAGISLYRPGPMDQIPTYIENKRSPNTIKYLCPALENILNVTYGCMVYQEQVMQIVRDLAGYDMAQSDNVRRIMSKKKMDKMMQHKEYFIHGEPSLGITGCVKNGISEEIATQIFDQMTEFAKYAFNKSHAACYAVLAYETAYLKTYYPAEFLCALLTSVTGDEDKVPLYIHQLKQRGIEVLGPSVNESQKTFSVENGKIRFGLLAVKNLGENAIDEILQSREENGKFKDFSDFIDNVPFKALNKRAVENLIKAGAFDSLDVTRKTLMSYYEGAIDEKVKISKTNIEGQVNLFDGFGEESEDSLSMAIPVGGAEFEEDKKLSFEKESLGLYLSGHPLDKYSSVIEKYVTLTSTDLASPEDSGIKPDDTGIMAGMIVSVKQIFTKKNSLMAFITVQDLFGTFEATVFPRTYEKASGILTEDSSVLISVAVQENLRDDSLGIIVNDICSLTDEEEVKKVLEDKPRVAGSRFAYKTAQIDKKKINAEIKKTREENKAQKAIQKEAKAESKVPSTEKRLWIKLNNNTAMKMDDIKKILKNHSGKSRVVLYDEESKKRFILSDDFSVSITDELMLSLEILISKQNLAVT